MFKKTILILLCFVLPFPVSPALAEETIQPIQRLGTGVPTSIAASPDGKTLAVGSSIGVWLLDAATLQPFGFWDTGFWVKSVEYSTDGRYLRANEMALDVTNGKPVNVDVKQIEWLDHLCDVDRGVCIEVGRDSLKIKDMDTLVVVTLIRAYFAAFDATSSSDGKTIYGVVGGVIKAWDATGRLKGQLENFYTGFLRKVFWSQDGLSVVSQNVESATCWVNCSPYHYGVASPDGITVRTPRSVWSVETAQLVRIDDCWYSQFSCDWPAMTDWYDRIQFRESISGKVLREFRPHRLNLTAATLSSDRKWLATSGSNNFQYSSSSFDDTNISSVRIWDVESLKLIAELPGQFYDLAASPDNGLLIGHTESGLEAWDWRNARQVWQADEKLSIPLRSRSSSYRYRYQKQGLSLNPAGELVATYAPSTGNTAHLYRLSSGELIATLTGHTAPITGVAFSPDGSKVAASSGDGTVLVWAIP
jgi:WD40 repeat protein